MQNGKRNRVIVADPRLSTVRPAAFSLVSGLMLFAESSKNGEKRFCSILDVIILVDTSRSLLCAAICQRESEKLVDRSLHAYQIWTCCPE